MYNIAPTYVASMSIQAKIELAQLLYGQSCLLDLEVWVALRRVRRDARGSPA